MCTAGLLTYGSTTSLRLPADFEATACSGVFAGGVPDYSGGTVPEFNRIPY